MREPPSIFRHPTTFLPSWHGCQYSAAIGGGIHTSTGLPAQEALGDDFPMWIVYVSQNLTFGGGLLGITYGIMSTSWDPSREGTVSQCAPQGEGQSLFSLPALWYP